ncbi:MAG: gamma-glutamyltransferase [Steroidobacteraceae bacterium]
MRIFTGLLACVVVASQSVHAGQSVDADQAFSPDHWPKADLARYLDLEFQSRVPVSMNTATAAHGMVVGTPNPLAIHAGVEALKHGGNAADAAITTALTQVALTAGATMSYAGILHAIYYDAAASQVYALDAGYNTLKSETDPLSIPAKGTHSGRTVLVPGFIAGIQALHDRFGKLPLRQLYEPATWVADHGVPFNPAVQGWLSQSGSTMTRLPDTRRIFTHDDGRPYQIGENFRQPQLAATLKEISTTGASYFYTGTWASHFVDAVRREGGNLTLDDLASYRAQWSEPIRVRYRDFDVLSVGNRDPEALRVLGGLKTAEALDLKRLGPYSQSSEALYSLIQIYRKELGLLYQPGLRKELELAVPGAQQDENFLLRADTAAWIAQRIQSEAIIPRPAPEASGEAISAHTGAVVTVDEQGNVACVIHTINTSLWGTTGLFVDGISIPDSASFQQSAIAAVGAGHRLPATTVPLMALQDGHPILGAGVTGSSGAITMLENALNVLDFNMDPATAVAQPNTLGPYLGISVGSPSRPVWEVEAIRAGDFPDSVLEGVRARGQPIRIIDDYSQDAYWVGIRLDFKAHRLLGGSTYKNQSLAEGY